MSSAATVASRNQVAMNQFNPFVRSVTIDDGPKAIRSVRCSNKTAEVGEPALEKRFYNLSTDEAAGSRHKDGRIWRHNALPISCAAVGKQIRHASPPRQVAVL